MALAKFYLFRKSGDNRTGIKAEDKRGGGGKVIFPYL